MPNLRQSPASAKASAKALKEELNRKLNGVGETVTEQLSPGDVEPTKADINYIKNLGL
jgi:hypothetical protein